MSLADRATSRTLELSLGFLVLLAATGCFSSDGGLGPLFGAPDDGGDDGGFDEDEGGSVKLLDLFFNARYAREAPTVMTSSPADGEVDVAVTSLLAVQFSESMAASRIQSGLAVFPEGSSTPVAGVVNLFQGQTVAVFIPQGNLLPDTDYEIVVPGNLTDLQDQQIEIEGEGLDQRFRFTTAPSSVMPTFRVTFTSPVQRSGNAARSSELLLLFSEAVSQATSGGGLLAPGNLEVLVNGQSLTEGTDYTIQLTPATTPRVLQIVATTRFPATGDVQAQIAEDVANADGQKTLEGGDGFTLRFTAQDAAVADQLSYPNSFDIDEADGFISNSNIMDFRTSVGFTADGRTASEVTLVLFDPALNRAFVTIQRNPSDPVELVTNLQPEDTSPFNDGVIEVGAYIESRGFVSEVSIVGTLLKDTMGPRLEALGPPTLKTPLFGLGVLYSDVNDPVVFGRMDEPCLGVSIDFNNAGSLDFNSVLFRPGLSTVEEDFFVTGSSVDALITSRLEPFTSFAFIASDRFGNGAISLDDFALQTIGVVGARIQTVDGNTALAVVAYPGDKSETLSPLLTGAVILESFPPDASGVGQVVKTFQDTLGLVKFTEVEVNSIPTSQITVTVIASGYDLVTIAGLNKPTAASPIAFLPVLDPSMGRTTLPVTAKFDNLTQNAQARVGATQTDLELSSDALDRMNLLSNPEGDPFSRTFNLGDERIQVFSAVEEVGVPTQLRYSSSDPFSAVPADGGGGAGSQRERTVDFAGRQTYSEGTDQPFDVTFDNTQVVGDGTGNPGPLGLVGNELAQFRRLRLTTRLPGFSTSVAVAESGQLQSNGNDRIGTVILPPEFQRNDSTTTTGVEDSPLELLLQPGLSNPATAVDPAVLNRNVRAELHIQDLTEPAGGLPSSAYTRQRFLITSTTLGPVGLQQVPTILDPAEGGTVTHPPSIEWPEVTSGEGVHCVTLKASSASWRILVAAAPPGGTIVFQVPRISTSAAIPPNPFQNPGTFNALVESFDFDPFGDFSSGSPEMPYEFNFDRFFLTDLDREHLRASRSDPQFRFSTQ